ADRLGISQVQVSRLEKKILKQIKNQMDHFES
ncbi:RNA polymerase sigma-F factor, partial [Bacillus haynesii]|nr:RNA polymerase sigma-F factor [Bacillus haynesii]